MIRTSLDFIYDNSISMRYNDTYTIADFGKYYVKNRNSSEINNDFLLIYNRNIATNFSLNISGGGNMLIQKYYYLNTDNGDLLKPDLFTVSNASALTANEGGATEKINSLYGFATLGYKNYLFLDLTARNDWSPILTSSKKSYFYPSAGLTWLVSDMVKTLPGWVTFAKLRASLARVYTNIYPNNIDPINNFNTGGTLGFSINGSIQPAANQKPEITTSKELGMNIRFFQNRVDLDFTLYKSNSENQLLVVPLPDPSGYNYQYINGGNIQNSGYEATLNLKPVSKSNFTWDIAVNFSHNKNLVISLTEGLTSYVMRSRSWMTTVKAIDGQEYGDIYARGFIRNNAGRIVIGTNGLPVLTAGQTVRMGNYNPDWLGGIMNSFTYKQFDFNFLIDMRMGGDVLSFTEANLASDGFSDYTLTGRDGFVVNGVVQTKDASGNVISETENKKSVTSEQYWQMLGGRNTPVGEAFKYDASNIRIREAVLGYTKPVNIVIIKSIRFSLFGRNLFFLMNKAKRFDPNLMPGTTNIQGVEGFSLPGTRTIGMNLKVIF
jgi:outer membrane receptor protein involved in Fe transport